MEFSRPEYWSGYPVPSPWDLPNPGIEPGSPALQVDSLSVELPGKPHIHGIGIAYLCVCTCRNEGLCVYGYDIDIDMSKDRDVDIENVGCVLLQ